MAGLVDITQADLSSAEMQHCTCALLKWHIFLCKLCGSWSPGPDILFPAVFCGEGRGNTHAAVSSVLGTSIQLPFALDTGLTGLG